MALYCATVTSVSVTVNGQACIIFSQPAFVVRTKVNLLEFQNISSRSAMEPTYFAPVSFAVKLLIPLDFVLLPVQALNPELLRPYYPHSLMILSFILQVIIQSREKVLVRGCEKFLPALA